MAASYVRSTAQRISNGSNNITINSTGSDSIVVTFAFSVQTDSVTSVSYQGKAGSKLAEKSDTTNRVEIWIISGPESNASGTLNAVVTNSAFCYLTAIMILAGNGSLGTATGNVTSGTLSIAAASTTDCIEIGVMCESDSYTITPGSGQTLISSDVAGGNYACRSDYKAGAASTTTLSWTPATNNAICGAVASIAIGGRSFDCPGIIG